jgi:hypothetical protein
MARERGEANTEWRFRNRKQGVLQGERGNASGGEREERGE